MNQEFITMEQLVEWAHMEAKAAERYLKGDQNHIVEVIKDAVSILELLKIKNSSIEVAEVLKMLLSGELLSPLEDVPEEFTKVAENIYQSKRYNYVYYMQTPGSDEKFLIDKSNVVTVDIHNPMSYTFEPFAMHLFYDEYEPLSFPYTPPKDPWFVYIEKCDANQTGSYDTLAVCYAKKPNSDPRDLKEIKRFFKRFNQVSEWEEINMSEYAFRAKKGGLL